MKVGDTVVRKPAPNGKIYRRWPKHNGRRGKVVRVEPGTTARFARVQWDGNKWSGWERLLDLDII